jgi:tRNA modification GTPase
VDTAGLRPSDDQVEQIGIARAWEEIGRADAVLFLHDLSRWCSPDRTLAHTYQLADHAIEEQLQALLPAQVPVIHVWNKRDALPEDHQLPPPQGSAVVMSAKTGLGLAQLRAALLEVAGWQSGMEGSYMARERHVQALHEVEHHLVAAAEHLLALAQLDLAAEELRLAQQALGAITGELGSDDLLGLIFSSFCIGK